MPGVHLKMKMVRHVDVQGLERSFRIVPNLRDDILGDFVFGAERRGYRHVRKRMPYRQISHGSQHAAYLIELKARQPREQLAAIAVAEIAYEVGMNIGSSPEFSIQRLGIEARHWAAVESDGARRHKKVSSLQGAIAKRGQFGMAAIGCLGKKVFQGRTMWEKTR